MVIMNNLSLQNLTVSRDEKVLSVVLHQTICLTVWKPGSEGVKQMMARPGKKCAIRENGEVKTLLS